MTKSLPQKIIQFQQPTLNTKPKTFPPSIFKISKNEIFQIKEAYFEPARRLSCLEDTSLSLISLSWLPSTRKL